MLNLCYHYCKVRLLSFPTSRGKHSRDISLAIRLLVSHRKMKSNHNLDNDSDDGSVITFNHTQCCMAQFWQNDLNGLKLICRTFRHFLVFKLSAIPCNKPLLMFIFHRLSQQLTLYKSIQHTAKNNFEHKYKIIKLHFVCAFNENHCFIETFIILCERNA